ncbi:MAG: glutamine amidotransferase [Chlorobi bacterium]|nr:glutamine amidotransferase [Chlorobiota bacterium]
MKKLCIIKAGSTHASTLKAFGDFEDWIAAVTGNCGLQVHVVHACAGQPLPEPSSCCGVIVSGSHAMVTDNSAWSLAIEAWICLLVRKSVPFFGICYGHQLLGRALDGVAGYNPRGLEIGTVSISVTPEAGSDPLFGAIPRLFHAHAIHEQSVLELPPGAVCLARNEHEPHHAFRIGTCAWGVQFHPEYTVPVMNAYITARRKIHGSGAGDETAALLSGVRETPFARDVLAGFAAIASRHC